jgi:carbamoyltransferase
MADRWILGLNCYDHDVSACLLRNGAIEVMIAKERLTRVKHDSGFTQEVTDYCLGAAGIKLDSLDLVVRNSYVLPVPEFEDRLATIHQPYHLDARERRQAETSQLFRSRHARVVTCSHHLAHAWSAFAASPFEEGAVMVVDGVGSYRSDVLEPVPPDSDAHPLARESESYYRFRGTELETVEKVWMGPNRGVLSDEFYWMPGLGALYSRVSHHVFGHWNKCGEVMGLAPYGRPGIGRLVTLDREGLRFAPWPKDHVHPFLGGGDRAWEQSPHRKAWEDLAWQVQDDLETALVERARRLHERTRAKDLVIAGGVGLNCVANGKILAETPFERLFVQPAAGDDGIALGCALYGHHALRKEPRRFVMTTAAWGRPYRDEEVERALRRTVVRLATSVRRPDDLAADTAALLARGAVVGWFQGRSEVGPRALGQRSILADPRSVEVRDRLNARVKHRQAFRPFAPVVLAERAGEWFEGEAESPFMLLVKRVRPEARSRVAGIVHVDGTARVQTLRRETNPPLHDLLVAFDRLTGVPVLLNTSFNVKGEPIVESPEDAIECFLATALDALVLHERLVTKRAWTPALRGVLSRFATVGRSLRREAIAERSAEALLSRYR